MAFKVNLIPNREFTVIHLNQYEYGVGNTRTVAIYNGDVPFDILSGSDVTIEGVKPDGNAFAYNEGITFEDNEVTFELQDQMTVLSGQFPVEIIIRNSRGRWSTKNLMFDVEQAPVNENTPVSDEDIPAYIDLAHRNAMKAVNSAESAVEAAANAKTSETNAKSSEINAKTSETNAKSSEIKAKTSETNAKTSETNAAASEANAAVSEANAKESELIAKDAADDVRPIITETGAFVETENARAEKLFYLKVNMEQKTSGGYTSVTFTRTGIGGANSKTYKVNFPSSAGTVTSGTLEVNADGTATLVAGGETYVITDVPVVEMLDDYNKIQANITGTIEISYRNNSKLNDYLDLMRGISYDEITQAGTVTETGKMVVDAVQLNPNVAGTIAKRLGQAESTVVDVRSDITNIQQNVSSIQNDVAETKNDVSGLQTNLNSEISDRTAQDAVLSARMDEFAKLPDGSLSTAADAELVDIRVMANGTTAETAGDAVREQIESINDDLAVLDLGLEYSTNRFSGEYTGVIPPSSASGSDTPNANNSTTDFISAEYGDRIYCGHTNNIASALASYNPVFVTEYDEQKQWLHRSGQYPAVNDENEKLIYTITNANTKYVRVSFANNMVITSGRLFEIAINISTAGYIPYTPYFAPRVISKRLDRIEDAIDRNVNMKVIDCWGDSRTEMIASQGTSFCDYLQATLGDAYIVCNYGESSQSSGMCAARLGSNEVFVALTNNQIPASGEVQLTNIRCTSGNNRNLFAYSKTSYIPCMLNGVRGRLSRASISTYDDVKFIRDSDGTAVNVHARSKIVVPDMGSKNHLCVLWWGKNDFSNAAQYVVSGIYDNYVKAVKYLGHDKFVILGETCSIKTSYETGGTDRTNLDNLNRMLATEYPDNFIDINAYLSSEQALTDIGLTATAEDLAFIEKGFPCYQLMVYSTNETDTTHPNEYGRQAIANRIYSWMKQKGWVY